MLRQRARCMPKLGTFIVDGHLNRAESCLLVLLNCRKPIRPHRGSMKEMRAILNRLIARPVGFEVHFDSLRAQLFGSGRFCSRCDPPLKQQNYSCEEAAFTSSLEF